MSRLKDILIAIGAALLALLTALKYGQRQGRKGADEKHKKAAEKAESEVLKHATEAAKQKLPPKKPDIEGRDDFSSPDF